MFGKAQKRISELEQQLEDMRNAASELAARNTLIMIEREGRYNRFTFAVNGSVVIVETMGLLSDDVSDWKRKLGI